MERRAMLLVLAALAGCSALPRDPDGTLERVRASRVFRVGVTPDSRHSIGAGDLAGRVERATGARARFVLGGTEQLLRRLEAGGLELVVLPFDPETPWKTRVALGPRLFWGHDLALDKQALELRAAATNGENRWIMLIERESRALAEAAP